MGYRPIIGISGNLNEETRQHSIKDTYFQALMREESFPVLLPRVRDRETAVYVISRLDGLLLAGGGDILPSRFGEETLAECGKIEDERDESELLLIEAALEAHMPVFGICRGVQILAVALGATLFQDIPSQLGIPSDAHRQAPPYDNPHHVVRFKEGGLFERITGTQLMPTNSMHHQAVAVPGGSLVVDALCDGIVEAVHDRENEEVFGVQFHPEFFSGEHDYAQKLFDYFADAAEKHGNKKQK